MTVQTDLLLQVEAFLAAHKGMSETTFGKLAVNDGKFVRRLRDRSNMTLATIDRVLKFMAGQQPSPEPRAKRDAAANANPAPKPKRSVVEAA